MRPATSEDTQWDRVIEIASTLWIDGQYVAEIDPSPSQRFVDLQWAAHQAGRVLGGRTSVHVGPARGPADPTVTVTVTYLDPDGRSLQRAEEGLEKLMRKVLTTQDHR